MDRLHSSNVKKEKLQQELHDLSERVELAKQIEKKYLQYPNRPPADSETPEATPDKNMILKATSEKPLLVPDKIITRPVNPAAGTTICATCVEKKDKN